MPSTRAGAVAIASAAIATAVALAVIAGPKTSAPTAAGGLALNAPLPAQTPPGATLAIGDPVTRSVLEHTGWIRELPFHVVWAKITGGPAVTEAFHARALDVGAAADMPPLHATWIGMPVKIVAVRQRLDPLDHPLYVLGLAPHAGVRSLADLRGKKIAFSPGQVQGEVVLRTLAAAGLGPRDVTLVELPSTGGDLYVNALAAGVVDVAPIAAGTQAGRYLAKFSAVGASVLAHPKFRDDLTVLYVRRETLQDPGKAAALRAYVALWARAAEWERAHPAEFAQLYYEKDQGLSADEARAVVAASGEPDIPRDWGAAIAQEQAAADVMGRERGRPGLDAASLFDRRFEPIAARAAAAQWAREGAPTPRLAALTGVSR
ncbi:MAG TPA: ABC transporter substrate-binding protein [Caulobacteraceae bacterium]|jgi:sulfonate transport system substrate-binding protein|nr:ABC transporter substrate-binding protein [Caulobacteraceae bacterium]